MNKAPRKPKALLILPPSTVYFGDPTAPVITPPLGLAYIAAYLEKHNYPVEILDAIAEGEGRVVLNEKKKSSLYGLKDSEIIKKINKSKPDIVGIACMYTAYCGDAHRVAELVKKYNPKIPVVLGGSHATIFPELTLKDKNIDMVVLGEGEETFLEIVRRFEKGKSLTTVKGAVVKKGKKIVKNPDREPIKDLNSIPFPARHLLPMDKYLESPDYSYTLRPPAAPMITSRGCPGRCIYCSIHSVWRHSWRGRSPENVVDEMELLKNEYGVGEIEFFDDSMGADKKRLEGICNEIIERGLDIKWSPPNGIAHWTLDEKLLDKMKKAGCYRITFGIESGNRQTRKFIGKPYDLDQAKRMIKHANKIGMWTICTNIIGFPDETREQINDTVNYAVNSDTDLAIFYLLCPHPGTKVYEIFKKNRLVDFDYIFTPQKTIQSKDYAIIGKSLAGRGVKTNNFSGEELREILSSAYATFMRRRLISFLNPIRILRKINSWEDLMFVIKIIFLSIGVYIRKISSHDFGPQMLRRRLIEK